ncbi:MAG: hypothetical protein ACFE8E_09315 [Candidatus Hodarchaeota archaeon]
MNVRTTPTNPTCVLSNIGKNVAQMLQDQTIQGLGQTTKNLIFK